MQLAAMAMKGRGFMLCTQRSEQQGVSSFGSAQPRRCCFLSVASSCCYYCWCWWWCHRYLDVSCPVSLQQCWQGAAKGDDRDQHTWQETHESGLSGWCVPHKQARPGAVEAVWPGGWSTQHQAPSCLLHWFSAAAHQHQGRHGSSRSPGESSCWLEWHLVLVTEDAATAVMAPA